MPLSKDLEELTREQAAQSLRESRGSPGLSRAWCSAVLSSFATDVAAAVRLSSMWPEIVRYGDEPSVGFRIKAISLLLAGDWAASAAAFQRAGTAAVDPVERLSFQVGAIEALARAGQGMRAVRLGRRLASGLEELGESVLAARARLNLGNALQSQDRLEAARSSYLAAYETLASAGLWAEAGSALMGLSTTHLYGGSLAQAERFAREAIALAETHGLEHLGRLCMLNLANAQLLRGRPDASLQTLAEVESEFRQSPPELARVREFVGDCYYRLNLWEDATASYASAMRSDDGLIALHLAHLHAGLGEAQLSNGLPREAENAFRAARRRYLRVGNRSWAARAAVGIARSLRHGEAVGPGRKWAAVALRESRENLKGYLRAEALSRLAELLSDPQLANEALKLLRGGAHPHLEWVAWAVLAKFGERRQRLRAYRRMFASMMAGRVRISSLLGRAGYLNDKADPIREYLGELFEDGRPQALAEAERVIQEIRAVALLDEMLAATSSSEQVRDVLDRLRANVQEFDHGLDGGGARRATLSASRNSESSRQAWSDLLRFVRVEVLRCLPEMRRDSCVYAISRHGVYTLHNRLARRLEVGSAELDGLLRWVGYYLLEPMIDRGADAAPATAMLEQLASALGADWEDGFGISPEGLLWQVPWAACAGIQAPGQEIELRLHPAMGGHGDRPLSGSRALLLWSGADDLPFARRERSAFLRSFPDAAIAETAEQARRLLDRNWDLVHVSAHARHRAQNPMFSSILFPDGALTALEIARSGLSSPLVTLGACDSGTMSVHNHYEPDGLARAFLARGALNVLASTWPLDDQAAELFFGVLFERLREGDLVRDGVRRARAALRTAMPHPYFWGSLVLYGGYAK